jgi:hypothetical protein
MERPATEEAAGRPHGGGRRAYGYQSGTHVLVEAEAAIVREIFARYLDGESLRGIAWDLNARNVTTAYGHHWAPDKVARIVDAPRYAGLRVFRGEIARSANGDYLMGAWQPCITVAEWEKAQAQRLLRAQADAAGRQPNRQYLLTGLLWCARCERHMVGSVVDTYRMYACTANSRQAPDRCSRHIAAETLETFIQERAIQILLDRDDRAFSTEAFDGVVTGPTARFAWHRLPHDRRAAVLRAVFAAVRIGPSSTPRSVFDYGRVEAVPNQT